MISLDQVLLLQKKVETAVERISFLEGQVEQLKSDNDALLTKCSELTKALEEKTELVSSLEVNQGKIEEGILNALSRLDAVENTILTSNSSETSSDEQDSTSSSEEISSEEEQGSQEEEPQQGEQEVPGAVLNAETSNNNENQSQNNEQLDIF